MKRPVAVWLPCKLANGVFCCIPLFDAGTQAIDRARRVLRADRVEVGPPCLRKPAAREELVKLGATRDQAARAEVVNLRWWTMPSEEKL